MAVFKVYFLLMKDTSGISGERKQELQHQGKSR
jgi:hypothetical protein